MKPQQSQQAEPATPPGEDMPVRVTGLAEAEAEAAKDTQVLFEETVPVGGAQRALLFGIAGVLVIIALFGFTGSSGSGALMFRGTFLGLGLLIAVVGWRMAHIELSVHSDRIDVQQGPFHGHYTADTLATAERGQRSLLGVRSPSGTYRRYSAVAYANRFGPVVVILRSGGHRPLVVSTLHADDACAAINAMAQGGRDPSDGVSYDTSFSPEDDGPRPQL